LAGYIGIYSFVKDNLNAVEHHTESNYGEHVWCKIDDLVIGLCYRSDNVSVVGQNNESQLRQVLKEVCDRNVLVFGDFNYPGIDWPSSTTLPSACSGAVDFLDTVENCF